jgi:type II secretory pathway component PulM
MNVGAAVQGYWRAISARERAVLTAGAVLVLGAALYLFLWEPGMAARRSLSASLPRLRAQLEDMRWQREEVLALRKKLGASSTRGDVADTLRASAALAQFASAIERIEALPGGKARIQAGPVPFHAWLAWADNLHRELGVRIEACAIHALDPPGMVQVEASFSGGGAP